MANPLRIQQIGNEMLIWMDDNTKVYCLPTMGGLWIAREPTGNPDPGPDPDPTGELEFPFTPTPYTEGGDMPAPGTQAADDAEFGPRSLTGAFHEGMDAGYGSMLSGAPITAAGNGVVHTNQTNFMGYGTTIIINHGDMLDNGTTVYTLYAHRQSVEGPSVGNNVTRGQLIGHVGNTGDSFGAHLHFEVHIVPSGGSLAWDRDNPSYDSNRTAVDPRDVIA